MGLVQKCIPIDISEIACEALLVDVNGTYKNANCTEQKTPYNESCELECDLGYVASGDGVQTCQLNGIWSSHIHCVGRITRSCIYCTHVFHEHNIGPKCLEPVTDLAVGQIGNFKLDYVAKCDK